MDDTVTIRAGAELRILGNRSDVNRKCPKWFTPNCVSKPSWVLPLGHAITPAISNTGYFGRLKMLSLPSAEIGGQRRISIRHCRQLLRAAKLMGQQIL